MNLPDGVRPGLARARWMALVVLGAGALAGGSAAAQERAQGGSAPPPRIGPIWDGQRHQPSRGEVEERLRARGTIPRPEERRDELRELNELSRELLPPGSPLPAPEVARDAPVRGVGAQIG